MIYFLLFLQQLIASTTHLVAQDASHALAPDTVLLFRASGASLIFFPMLVWTEKRLNIFRRLEREDYGRMLLVGLLNVPVNQLLYLHGVKYTTPANSALLYAMTPAVVFLLMLGYTRKKPSLWKSVGILLAFIGAAMIMFERGATQQSEHTYGNLLIFIAVIAWSLYTMLGRQLVLKYGPIYTTGLNMIIGTILYLPYGLFTLKLSDIQAMDATLWGEVAYLASIASVVNYVLWYTALSRLETTKVAIFQNLQPVMTTILALMLGKVILTTQLWAGGILALIGVLLVQLL